MMFSLRNRKGTLPDGTTVEYVQRRDGGYTPIPVGPDGKVPVEALRERNDRRDPVARNMDGIRVAKVVRPQDLTPTQAAPWWNAPGRSDIVGIDAPGDSAVTWAPRKKKEPKQGGKTTKGSLKPASDGRYYHPIDEDLAKRGLESYSWSRYQPGSATENYRRTVDQVYDIAEEAKRTARPAYHAEIDRLARDFAEKYGKWVNTKNSIDASNVSPMIAGPSRYDYKKRDKQTARSDAHWQEHWRIMQIPERIQELGRPDRNVDIREPDALDTLDRQIADLEAEQDRMKKVNAYWRKHGTLKGCPQLPEGMQSAMEKVITGGGRASDKPYEDFELSGNREKIKRLKRKRDDLASTKAAGSSSTTDGDIEVIEDTEAMRIRIRFPDKPEEDVRSILKQNGFKWSQSTMSWQRQLNDAGREATKRAMSQIAKVAGEDYGMNVTKNLRRR